MPFVAGQILHLLRIGGVVVQLVAIRTILAPFRVAVALGANAVTVGILRERRFARRGSDILQGRRQADTSHEIGRLYPGQFRQRGIEVGHLSGGLGRLAGGRHLGRGNNKRHTGGVLEQRRLLIVTMLAHVVTMVGGEQHDRILRQARFVQCFQNPSQLGVGKRDGSVVRLNRFPRNFFLQVDLFLFPLHRRLRGFGNGLQVALGHLGHDDLFPRIHLEILLRRDIRRVRAIKPHGQIEGRFVCGVLFQQFDRFGRRDAVGLFLIRAVGRQPTERAAITTRHQTEDFFLFMLVTAFGVDRVIPRSRIVMPRRANVDRHTIVINLANPRGRVAGPAKHL